MKVIPFSKIRWIAVVIALCLITAGLIYAFTVGPNWGIDFKDGLSMTVSVKDFNAETHAFSPAQDTEKTLLIETVRSWFEGSESLKTQPKVQLQSSADSRYTLRTVFADLDKSDESLSETAKRVDAEKAGLIAAMKEKGITVVESAKFHKPDFTADGRVVVIESTQSSSPSWTGNSWKQLFVLMVVVFILITLYIWVRFRWTYAIAATLALLHDVLIMIGFICIFPFEVTKTTIAALLTIVGYSLNDTIVIFDRVRENQRLMIQSPLSYIVDASITQSLSRTLLTSFTTLLAVVSLLIFTRGDVQSFAANMTVGVVFGTFSSNFIAGSVFIWLTQWANAVKAKRTQKKLGLEPVKAGADSAAAAAGGASATASPVVEIPKLERKLRRKRK